MLIHTIGRYQHVNVYLVGNVQVPAPEPNCDRNLDCSSKIQTESRSDRTRKQRNKSGEICDKSSNDITTKPDAVKEGRIKILKNI